MKHTLSEESVQLIEKFAEVVADDITGDNVILKLSETVENEFWSVVSMLHANTLGVDDYITFAQRQNPPELSNLYRSYFYNKLLVEVYRFLYTEQLEVLNDWASDIDRLEK